MGGIASKNQLRMSFARWAIVIVPLLLLLGFLSGSGTADQLGWYAGLSKPAGTPPAWLFPVAWAVLYILTGLALAIVLNARGASGRAVALVLFVVQFALNLAWTPVFFGAHRLSPALWVLVGMIATAVAATLAFGRIRSTAAWLMVPYLAWLCYAGALTWRLVQLNPDAGVARPAAATQILG